MIFARIIECMPHGPEYKWDWEGLYRTPLKAFFERMEATTQEKEWHGEGDVMTHTRMVCEALSELEAFRSLPEKRQRMLALAALLHDVGKITRTRQEDGRLVSPGHGAAGAAVVRKLLWQDFGLGGTAEKQDFRETVCLLIRYHTLPLHILDQKDPMLRVRKVAANGENVPGFCMNMLCMLAEADVRGRISADSDEKQQEIQLGRELAKEAGCLLAPYAFPNEYTCRAYLMGRNVWPEQPLYDDTWGEVILMCGLPGTGKDTWIMKNFSGLPTVCLDDIRGMMGIKPTDPQGEVVQKAKEMAKEYLRMKQPFVWNATSITPMLRDKQIKLFEEYGARVRIVYLETGWEEGLRRNRERQRNVPETAIDRMLANLIPPERHEAAKVEWICT